MCEDEKLDGGMKKSKKGGEGFINRSSPQRATCPPVVVCCRVRVEEGLFFPGSFQRSSLTSGVK